MRRVKIAQDEFYHIYNRGNSKQVIFRDRQDYERFMKLLYMCNGRESFNFRDSVIERNIEAYNFEKGSPIVEIHCFTLMPNHFHLLIKQPPDQAKGEEYNISYFMKKICG